jgi:hypothetical protein
MKESRKGFTKPKNADKMELIKQAKTGEADIEYNQNCTGSVIERAFEKETF